LLKCYQQPDRETLLVVVTAPHKQRAHYLWGLAKKFIYRSHREALLSLRRSLMQRDARLN